jgi:hypothetical protein
MTKINGYGGCIARGRGGGDLKLTTGLHLVRRLRMSGVIPLFFSCLQGVDRERFTFVFTFLFRY